MQHSRAILIRVWYRSPYGGSLFEIANNDKELDGIEAKLRLRQLPFRIQRYYFVT